MSTEINIGFLSVEEIPKRTFKKGSKYDVLFTNFLNQKKTRVKLTIPEDLDASYLTTQLRKRPHEGVKIILVNNEVYFERA